MELDSEGRICWTYEQNIRKHPMTLYILMEMIMTGVITLSFLALFGGGPRWALDIFLVYSGIFTLAGVIGWLIWSTIKKNKYVMTFAMDENQVVRTSPYGVTGYRDGNLYITRYKNETIARMMDHGHLFEAQVESTKHEETKESEQQKTYTEQFLLPFSVWLVK